MEYLPDTILKITKSSGIEQLYSNIYIRKNKCMNNDYPRKVCLICLDEACKDTKLYEGRVTKWSEYYTIYTGKCDVCGETHECTEPRDGGYPSFKYAKQRLRIKKINNIIKKNQK